MKITLFQQRILQSKHEFVLQHPIIQQQFRLSIFRPSVKDTNVMYVYIYNYNCQLRQSEAFVDVTLTAEGRNVKCHKVVLILMTSVMRVIMLTTEMTSVVIMVIVMGLDRFVNVFRYHFLDTETRFSRLSYLHAALISSNSSLKIPAR